MPQSPGVKTGPAGPPKAPKLPPAPSLKGVTGAVQAGTKPLTIPQQNVINRRAQTQRPERQTPQEKAPGHLLLPGPVPWKAISTVRERQQARPKYSLLDLATAFPEAAAKGAAKEIAHPKLFIQDIPKELKGEGVAQIGAAALGNLMHRTTGAIFGTKGPAAAIAQEATKLPQEAVNLPAQIAPTIAQAAKAAYQLKMGKPQATQKIERGLESGSLGQLLQLKPEAAAKQFGRAPLQSGLEYSGAAALLDRGAGLFSRITKRPSRPISTAPGSPTSRPAKPLIGNATEPQPPYGKGYVQNLIQRTKDQNQAPPGERFWETMRRKNLSTRMKSFVHKMEGNFHGAMQQTRSVAERTRADAIRGPRSLNGRVIPGVEAVNLYNHGILPDPSFRTNPLHPDSYQSQLQRLAARYNEPNRGEVTADKERIAARDAVERTIHDTGFERNPHAAYRSALKMAEDKRAYAPALQRLYGYTPEQMRNAILTPAFQHWFEDRQPWVEHATPLNEAGIRHEQNIQRAREFGEARRTSLQELREAQAHHANAEITTAQLNAIKQTHAENIAAHKQAVVDRKASAPKDVAEHYYPPFSISDGKGGRIHLSADEVVKELESKGVREQQLAFMSHRPFRSVAADLHPPPGVARGGVPPARGVRSGKAFLEGHVDLTHDGMARQYLSDMMHLERGHQNTIINRELGLTTRHAADLLQEHLANAAPAERAAIQARIDALRGGSTFFEPSVQRVQTPNGTTTAIRSSAWQNAQREAARIKALGGPTLVPYRIASPYAPGVHLDQIAHDVSPSHVHELLSPSSWDENRGLQKFEEPHPLDRGQVGLMHKAAADTIRSYEKLMGSNTRTILGNLSAIWRKQNVAWSQKHIPGVTQELGLRAIAYQAGPLSALRGYKALKDFGLAASDPAARAANPEIDHYIRMLEHMAGSHVIQQSMDQMLRLPKTRLENTALGKLGEAFDSWKTHTVTGFPARMLADLAKGYSTATNAILRVEQKAITKPFVTAGFGKAINAEAQRLTGKKLPILRQADAVMKDFIKGQFNPRSIDMLANTLREWYGDFQTASPATRHAQMISPFFTWYRQALKFIYHTLPVHHPIKTGILAALEGATEEQRIAEGQGYLKNLGLRPEGLQASQQGSVPSFRKNGKRWEVTYYMPSGAVSKGVEGLGDIFPYLEEPLAILKGRSAYTGRELPGHPEGWERVLLMFASLGEGFAPAARKIKLVTEGKAEKAFYPFRENAPRNPKGELITPREKVAPEANVYEPPTANPSQGQGQIYEK